MMTWQLTIDCSDPTRMVAFWAEALGYEPQPPPDGFESWNDWYLSVGVPAEELDLSGDGSDRLRDPKGKAPNVWFQPVPERKSIKNRLHLDIFVGGGRTVPLEELRRRVDGQVAEREAIGATIRNVSEDAFRERPPPRRVPNPPCGDRRPTTHPTPARRRLSASGSIESLRQLNPQGKERFFGPCSGRSTTRGSRGADERGSS